MATQDLLDFATLLAPIPGDNPAGRPLRDDLSHNAPYYVLRDARAAARAAERKQVWDEEDTPNSTSADWTPILTLAPKVIAEQAKDLEIVCWLIEALVREHGFTGLRDGFRLARQLVEGFWDNLYPHPDEEGVLTRVAPLGSLNGDDAEGLLVGPILNVPITQGQGGRHFGVSHYQQAAELDRLEDVEKREQRIAQGAVNMRQFEEELRETPAVYLRNLLDDLATCVEEYEKLGGLLDERCGKDSNGFALSPPSSNIRGVLRTCSEVVQSVSRDILASSAAPGEVAAADSSASPSAAGGRGSAPGKLQTREQAFQAILEIADFFRRTEPQSPVVYKLEEAVRWGRMPLAELLSEVIAEDGVRDSVFKLMGIRKKEV